MLRLVVDDGRWGRGLPTTVHAREARVYLSAGPVNGPEPKKRSHIAGEPTYGLGTSHVPRNSQYEEALRRYDELRRVSYELTLEVYSATYPGLVLTPITSAAAGSVDRLPAGERHPESREWSWSHLRFGRPGVRTNPARFEIALWNRAEMTSLHALAVGRVSHNRHEVRLDHIESFPPDARHPFRGDVIPIVVRNLVDWGYLLGASYAVALDAIEPTVPCYEEQGFSVVGHSSNLYTLRRPLEGDEP